MKASELIHALEEIVKIDGNDIEVTWQGPTKDYPDGVVLYDFFVVYEAQNGPPYNGMEIRIRSWPY